MSAASRRKGAKYERKIANRLKESLGISVKRRVDQWQTGGDDLDHELDSWLSIECKDVASTSLGSWVDQSVRSAGARIAVVIHHRRGNGNPARDFVTMELRDFEEIVLALIAGTLPEEVER